MWESSSDYQTTKGMSNKRNTSEACNRAELCYIVLDFIGKSHAHLEDVSFCLFSFVALAAKKYSIWMKYSEVVLEQSHIDTVALEAMLQYKKMHPDIVIYFIKPFKLTF